MAECCRYLLQSPELTEYLVKSLPLLQDANGEWQVDNAGDTSHFAFRIVEHSCWVVFADDLAIAIKSQLVCNGNITTSSASDLRFTFIAMFAKRHRYSVYATYKSKRTQN